MRTEAIQSALRELRYEDAARMIVEDGGFDARGVKILDIDLTVIQDIDTFNLAMEKHDLLFLPILVGPDERRIAVGPDDFAILESLKERRQ